MLLQHPIDVRDLGAGTRCDALFARTVDDIRKAALVGCHGVDDGFHPRQFLIRHTALLGHLCHAAHARQFVQHAGHAAQFFHLLELLQQIFQIKALTLLELLGQFIGFILVQLAFCFFHQAQHIAHAENPGRYPIRIEGFQGIRLFAHTDEFDGFAGNMPHREGSTATGITIGLGQHHAGQR